MSASLFEKIRHNIWRISKNCQVEKAEEEFKTILKLIDEADENRTTEWTK